MGRETSLEREDHPAGFIIRPEDSRAELCGGSWLDKIDPRQKASAPPSAPSPSSATLLPPLRPSFVCRQPDCGNNGFLRTEPLWSYQKRLCLLTSQSDCHEKGLPAHFLLSCTCFFMFPWFIEGYFCFSMLCVMKLQKDISPAPSGGPHGTLFQKTLSGSE